MAATEWSKNGPFVDNVLVKNLNYDQNVEALLDNQLDIIEESLDSESINQLAESQGILIQHRLRNGYGYLTINCGKYPLNETALRRAFAFALDKEAISNDVWDGQSVPLDSPIPRCNPYSIEGTIGFSYYQADAIEGNHLLDEAGFLIDPVTGFRNAPDGRSFHILIEVAQSSDIAIGVGEEAQRALERLHINSTNTPVDFYEYLNRLYFHGSFDIVFLGSSFPSFDVDWLAYEFWSEYADEPYCNFPKWRNSTYDSWRDQLIHSTDYESVYQASAQMQKIWVYECPEIICYENLENYAYREDTFRIINLASPDRSSFWWIPYNAHIRAENGGPFGGTLRISSSAHPKFNPFQSCSCYGTFTDDLPWETLLRRTPDGLIIPWLAESFRVESSLDNSEIPEDTTRITFTLLQNATWTDNTPLTSEDVAFSINFHRESRGNPYGSILDEMTACYSPNPWTVVVEFKGISYWNVPKFTQLIIVPKHVFGAPGFNLTRWNPDPTIAPIVTAGSFNYTNFESGSFWELSYNPKYFYGIEHTLNPNYPEEPENTTHLVIPFGTASMAITAGSLVVIAGVIILWKKEI
ncbi:MAG: ABC transporter substrate-binding protein [Candidatus Thorarchaeota archaeon]